MDRLARISAASACTLFVACSQARVIEEATNISVADAAQVVGGVSVDITSPGNSSQQVYDNLEIRAKVSSDLINQNVYVSLWADNTKVGKQTYQFTGNETKNFSRRVMWPFPGNYDAQFKFWYDGQYYEADTDSSRTNLRVRSTVKVRPVRFWNVRHKSSLPFVSSSFLAERVDGKTKSRTKTTNNVDGIFAQCGGNDRTQFRGYGTANFTPSFDPGIGSDCSDLFQLVLDQCQGLTICGDENADADSYKDCPPLRSCIEQFAIKASNENQANGYISAHVFNVESTMCGEFGRNFPFSDAGVSQSLIVMAAGLSGDASQYTEILAHELMHDTEKHCNVGSHSDGSSNDCDLSDCSSSNPSVRNLMCTAPGRDLTPGQCDLVKDFRWANVN